MSTTNEEASAETEQMETDELVIEIKKKIIPKSKSPNKASSRKEYDIKWEELPVFKPWLTSSKKSPTLAHCIACEKDLLGGKPELIKHGAAEKHRNNLVNIGWIKSDKSMKQKVYNCKLYSVEWEKVPEFKDWLTASKKDIYYAYCKACDKDLSAGKGELMKHSKVKKHLEAMKNFKPVDKKDRPIWSSDSEDDRKDFFLLKETLSENDDENSSSSSSSSESSSSKATSSPSPLPQTDNNSDEFPENTSNNENIEEIRDETINDDMFSLIFDDDSSSSISSLNSEENQNIIKSKKDPTSDTNFQEFNESLMEVEKPKTVKRNSKYVRKRPIDQPKKYPKKFVDMPEYKGWFMQSEKSKLYAYCRACKKDLSAGKSELKRHLEGNKHIQAANGIKTKHDVELVESNNELNSLEKASRTAEIKLVEFAGENGMLVRPGCFESFLRLLKSIVSDSEIVENISMERIMNLADGIRQTQMHYEVEYLEDEFDSVLN